VEEYIMVCPQCAAPLGSPSRFCSACGLPIPNLQSSKRSVGSQLARGIVFAFLAIGGLVAGLAIIGMFLQHRVGASGHQYGETASRERGQVVTLANYMQIENGMTYEQVKGIIGIAGEEISSSNLAGYSTVMYSWKNRNGSNMNAMFQNDLLVTKAQFGLR
jgi:hypothetical protein